MVRDARGEWERRRRRRRLESHARAFARAVVDASTSSSDACDRAAMFTTALIQSDFIRGRESELKESVRALRRAGETFTSKRAQGLGVTWKVAFGVDLE